MRTSASGAMRSCSFCTRVAQVRSTAPPYILAVVLELQKVLAPPPACFPPCTEHWKTDRCLRRSTPARPWKSRRKHRHRLRSVVPRDLSPPHGSAGTSRGDGLLRCDVGIVRQLNARGALPAELCRVHRVPRARIGRGNPMHGSDIPHSESEVKPCGISCCIGICAGHTNATKNAPKRTKKRRNNGRSDSNAALRNASSKQYPARIRGEADDTCGP